jgi:thioesterase domain-containing protein
MASEFVRAIRGVAPVGPVRLAGWSFGAITAFVAAQLLTSEERHVEQLLLIDPALPQASLGRTDRELSLSFIADVAESTGKFELLAELRRASGHPSLRKPADLFQMARDLGIFPVSTTVADFEHRFSVYTANANALRHVQLSPPRDTYRGRAAIVAASQGNAADAPFWRTLLPEAELTVIEATHNTILEQLRALLG